MSDKRLAKIEQVRRIRRDQRQLDYTRAKAAADEASARVQSMIAQRNQLAIDIVRQTEEEAVSLVNSMVEATSVSSIHDAWVRRQRGLEVMDQQIEQAKRERDELLHRAEEARIIYVKSIRNLDRWSKFSERVNERLEMEAERLVELGQDLTVRDNFSGKWVVRSTQ